MLTCNNLYIQHIFALKMDIGKWFEVLESMGTPKSFLTGVESRIVEGSQHSDLKYFITYNPNRDKRKELMETFQKKLSDRGIEISCHLCYQLGEENHPLFDKSYIFQEVPNKYPLLAGHSLLVGRSHNTTGNAPVIITKEIFDEIQRIEAEQEVNIGRNHVKAGMSIRDHEHFHFLPRRVLKTDRGEFDWEPTSGYELSEFGEPFYRIKSSPFADLAVKGKSAGSIAERLQRVLTDRQIIYTVNITPELINITIRRDSEVSQKNGYGISYGVNFVAQSRQEFEDATRQQLEDKAISVVYLREEFDWKPILGEIC